MLRLACVVALGFGLWWFVFRAEGCGTSGAIACQDKALDEGVGTTLSFQAVCAGAGYLCDGRSPGFQVMRWPLAQGKLRIRVALPDFGDEEQRRELRDAAIEGIREWDQRPFPLQIETKEYAWRARDIGVVWMQGAGGGHAHVRTNVDGKKLLFAIEGLQVRVPFDGVSREQQLAMVRATAAHEMGHALGLMHSDSPTDIMHFQFLPGVTPERISARDMRTVEALYALPNGARVQ